MIKFAFMSPSVAAKWLFQCQTLVAHGTTQRSIFPETSTLILSSARRMNKDVQLPCTPPPSPVTPLVRTIVAFFALTDDCPGDPFKDTSGPALNILMKLMAILSLVFAQYFTAINDGKGIFNIK